MRDLGAREGVYPFLLISSLHPLVPRYVGFMSTASKLWAEGGMKRMWRGFTPAALRAIPANGVMLYTVDVIGQMLDKSLGL